MNEAHRMNCEMKTKQHSIHSQLCLLQTCATPSLRPFLGIGGCSRPAPNWRRAADEKKAFRTSHAGHPTQPRTLQPAPLNNSFKAIFPRRYLAHFDLEYFGHILDELHSNVHQSIARLEIYGKSFETKSIGSRV